MRIKDFSYDKNIDSLSGKQTKLNLLKAFGDVTVLKDDLIFDDLYIKTNHPTDARIFNIIFRKPNIKQGQFTSDIRLNGKLSNVKILGDFHIFETNIPFLDTSMKNIELQFKDVSYSMAEQGAFEYIRRTMIGNPHAKITFRDPTGHKYIFKRAIL